MRIELDPRVTVAELQQAATVLGCKLRATLDGLALVKEEPCRKTSLTLTLGATTNCSGMVKLA